MASVPEQATWIQNLIQTGGGIASLCILGIMVLAAWIGRRIQKDTDVAAAARLKADADRDRQIESMGEAIKEDRAFIRGTLVNLINEHNRATSGMVEAVGDLKELTMRMRNEGGR